MPQAMDFSLATPITSPRLPAIHPAIPIGIGAAGQRILDRAADWLDRPKLDDRVLIHWQSGKPVTLGPFTITPLLVDHSAYDAYALLIEADGQRLFYSGDFRGHGRKAIRI